MEEIKKVPAAESGPNPSSGLEMKQRVGSDQKSEIPVSASQESTSSEHTSEGTGPRKRRSRFWRHAVKHGPTIFSGISAIASVISAIFFYNSLVSSDKSLKVALDGYQRGYVDHLSARYAISGDDEFLVVNNPGLMKASSIQMRRAPYFVFGDKALSAKGLGVALRTNAEMFNKLKAAGLIQVPSDYLDLMGPDREISITKLISQEQAQVEVSRSANENGIRVADALGAIFVVNWIATFNSGPDNVQTSQDLEFWLSHANTRVSLTDESWGQSASKRIEEAATTSKDYLLEAQPAPVQPPMIPENPEPTRAEKKHAQHGQPAGRT